MSKQQEVCEDTGIQGWAWPGTQYCSWKDAGSWQVGVHGDRFAQTTNPLTRGRTNGASRSPHIQLTLCPLSTESLPGAAGG